MADFVTSTTQVDPAVGLYYIRTLLEPNYPQYVHEQFAQKVALPAKNSKTVKFRRYARLSAVTTPMTEGVTPNGNRLSKQDLTATVSQYGSYVLITDEVDLTVEDPVLTKATELNADQMQNSRDVLTRNVLANNASSVTCSNGDPTATLLNRTDIDTATNTLRSADVGLMTPMIKAGTGQGTSPVQAGYVGIFHTDLENDLSNVSGFKEAFTYAAQKGVYSNEYGSVNRVRAITTTQGWNSSGTYRNPIIGKDAYGVIRLNKGSAANIIKGFGSGGTEDPLNQRATAGWVMWQVARILNDVNLIVLICTQA